QNSSFERFLEHTTGLSDLIERPVSITWLHVDRASRIGDNVHLEAFPDGIQRRPAHAIVLRQSSNPDSLHVRAPQPAGNVGTAKCGVGVRVDIHSLADDLHVARKLEVRVKRRAPRALHAVGRPGAAAFFKAHMVGRMPIPGRKNRNAAGFRLGNPSIQYGNDGVAVGHSQGSAGTKVILNVAAQDRIAGFKDHIDIVTLKAAWTYAARPPPGDLGRAIFCFSEMTRTGTGRSLSLWERAARSAG